MKDVSHELCYSKQSEANAKWFKTNKGSPETKKKFQLEGFKYTGNLTTI